MYIIKKLPAYEHSLQVYGLSSLCVFKWTFIAVLEEKLLPQVSQTWSFMFVWTVIICCLNVAPELNLWEHSLHLEDDTTLDNDNFLWYKVTYTYRSVCWIKWIFILDLRIILPHFGQGFLCCLSWATKSGLLVNT